MQKFKLDKKTIILVSFYVFLIVDVAAVVPLQLRRMVSLHSDLAKIQQRLHEYEKDKNLKDTFADRKESITINIEKLKDKIISSDDIITLSTYISSKAKENAVEIEEILPDKMEPYRTKPEGKFYYLPLRIKARAGFHNLAQFINELEEGFYFLKIKELQIKEHTPYHKVKLVAVAIVRE